VPPAFQRQILATSGAEPGQNDPDREWQAVRAPLAETDDLPLGNPHNALWIDDNEINFLTANANLTRVLTIFLALHF
jgi:hypothetical protein